MLKKLRKNNRGFTLVEVIVVAVIVAVLALVAVQLYQGYVTESRQNTAENLGASAAGFVQSGLNSGATAAQGSQTFPGTGLTSGQSWIIRLPASQATTTFTCPANAFITVTGSSLTATVGGRASQAYAFTSTAGGS